MNILWCNGDWVDGRDLSVSSQDRGLLHGLGLFETMLAVDGRVVFVDRHLDRFKSAVARLGWELSLAGVEDAMSELLKKNQLDQGRARLRMAVTAGEGKLNQLSLGADARLWMQCAMVEYPPEQISVMTSQWKRNDHSPLAGLKCASYAENLFALQEASQKGYDDALLFNSSDRLCEGTMSNVFLVKGDRLMTPDLSSGCLPGVTRAMVIDCATKLGIPIKESSLSVEDLQQADEIFMTSSTKGVLPVTKLDDRVLHVGGVTSQVRMAWERQIADPN